jgi:hypothetical protein
VRKVGGLLRAGGRCAGARTHSTAQYEYASDSGSGYGHRELLPQCAPRTVGAVRIGRLSTVPRDATVLSVW